MNYCESFFHNQLANVANAGYTTFMTITKEKPKLDIQTVHVHFKDSAGRATSCSRTVYGGTPIEAAELFDGALDNGADGLTLPPEDGPEAAADESTDNGESTD